MPTLPAPVLALLRAQDGVASRRQLLRQGVSDADLRTWQRRRVLRAALPGVYVDHTGTPGWHQRAWAADLYAAPTALHGASALRAESGAGRRDHDDTGPVHVVVAARRTVAAQPGVVVHRSRHLDDVVRWTTSPPRTRVEHAVLDVASAAADDHAAFAVVAGAVGARQTTADRLRSALEDRPRLTRRRFLARALDDLAAGVCSVLERAYLLDVERAHGLPTAARQVPASSRGPVYRDVDYPRWGVVVELDGRADHTRPLDRDRDLDRDLDAAADGSAAVTLRLGWGQVVGRPCRTARRVGRVLTARGWDGGVVPCRRCG